MKIESYMLIKKVVLNSKYIEIKRTNKFENKIFEFFRNLYFIIKQNNK